MLVAAVACDTSWMLTLFCIGLVNQSPVSRTLSADWFMTSWLTNRTLVKHTECT